MAAGRDWQRRPDSPQQAPRPNRWADAAIPAVNPIVPSAPRNIWSLMHSSQLMPRDLTSPWRVPSYFRCRAW